MITDRPTISITHVSPLTEQTRCALNDDDLLAAVDLGSNSFHMVVARYVLGQLRIVDRIKEHVRLADGLDGNGDLTQISLERALACLARFGQRLAAIPPTRVRAIATNTVRQLREPRDFLSPAEKALGHGIEVVAGREEARLIYLGVAHGHPPCTERRLVMDIGGGSTEFIIGTGFEALERESLQMGCIATTRRFFSDGMLSKKRWQDARTEITAEFQQFASTYRQLGWQETIGSSGTIKAIGAIASAMKLTQGTITNSALAVIRDKLLDADQIKDIRLPGLPSDRRPTIAGGLLILDSIFTELDIAHMYVSDNALREGVLYDIVGRSSQRDPRDASILALCERYATNTEQADRVQATALTLFDQIADDCALNADDRRLLAWAARVHEIGLAIAHSQYHQHGAYLIEHSDIAGFSKTEQQFLAVLIRNQRRSLNTASFEALPDRLAKAAQYCAQLLRLSVLLHRSHDQTPIPLTIKLKLKKLKAQGDQWVLKLPRHWLATHPLTQADLESECEYLDDIGQMLRVTLN